MAPTETPSEQVFHILPVSRPVPTSQIIAQIHKDKRRTVITIATIIGVAIVLSLFVFWVFRQRLVLSNRLSTVHAGKGAKAEVEASYPETRGVSPESASRWRVPRFSILSKGDAEGHDKSTPAFPELPITTDDLKKLGRDARELWMDRKDSLDIPGPNDIGLQRVSTSRSDETGSRGRSLTARPDSTTVRYCF